MFAISEYSSSLNRLKTSYDVCLCSLRSVTSSPDCPSHLRHLYFHGSSAPEIWPETRRTRVSQHFRGTTSVDRSLPLVALTAGMNSTKGLGPGMVHAAALVTMPHAEV